MKKKIKVLFLSAELNPFAKVGGLADVAGALPKAFSKTEVDLKIFLPFYGSIKKSQFKIKKLGKFFNIPLGAGFEKVELYESILPGSKVPVYLIAHKFFSGKEIYSSGKCERGQKDSRCLNDLEKFSFYTLSALVISEKLGFEPDVIHINDWHTALAPQFIKTWPTDFYKQAKTLLSIHNLSNQGIGGQSLLNFLGKSFSPLRLEKKPKKGYINFMAQGLMAADAVNTVSPSYAKEIGSKEYGAGLEKLVNSRKIFGILNGIDTELFNPVSDPNLIQNFSAKDWRPRSANKKYLQKRFGFKVDQDIPLIASVSRFVSQKGFDILTAKIIRTINKSIPTQWIFLGTGDAHQEDYLKALEKMFPGSVRVVLKLDLKLASLLYGAADIFLVPSRFEPCGLTQMIAMRYGAVPLVRATGGLKDTVYDGKNGFVFKNFNSADFLKTLIRALNLYIKQPKSWRRLQDNGAATDVSWKGSALRYLNLYRKLIK